MYFTSDELLMIQKGLLKLLDLGIQKFILKNRTVYTIDQLVNLERKVYDYFVVSMNNERKG